MIIRHLREVSSDKRTVTNVSTSYTRKTQLVFSMWVCNVFPKSTMKHYPFKTVANSLSRKVVFWKRETTSARYDALQPKWTLDMCQQLDDGANGMMVSIT